MSKQERRLKGKVTAYQVTYLPKRVDKISKNITITKDRKLAAMVTIQVDSRKYVVSAMKTEQSLDDSDNLLDPTPDLCKVITNRLIDQNPIDSEREFIEHEIFFKDGKSKKRYELVEED